MSLKYFTELRQGGSIFPPHWSKERISHLQRLIEYVQDNDLCKKMQCSVAWMQSHPYATATPSGKHELPHSKACAAGVGDLSVDMDVNDNPGVLEMMTTLKVRERAHWAIHVVVAAGALTNRSNPCG